jgi:ABC-type antimicrobial peptide transport system permease subunit
LTRLPKSSKPLVQDSVKKYVPAALRTEVRLMVQSLRDRQIHEVKLASWMLLGAVAALLLLACANVANLLLARAAARRGEWAMRAAFGATRARLIRQMLSESATLGILGGAAGVGLAFALLRTFIAIAPEGVVGLPQARVDTRVLLFAPIASLVSAMLFGLAHALDRTRAESLAGWRAIGSSNARLRRTLWRSLISGVAANTRDRRSDGARRYSRENCRPDSETGV